MYVTLSASNFLRSKDDYGLDNIGSDLTQMEGIGNRDFVCFSVEGEAGIIHFLPRVDPISSILGRKSPPSTISLWHERISTNVSIWCAYHDKLARVFWDMATLTCLFLEPLGSQKRHVRVAITQKTLANFSWYAHQIEAFFNPVHAVVKLWMVDFFHLELHCAQYGLWTY